MPHIRGEKRWMHAGAKLAGVAGLVLSLVLVNPASGATNEEDRQIEGFATGINITTLGDPTTFVAEEHGRLTHLGDSVVHVEGTSTLTASGVALAGNATIVAANGDELRSRFSGSGVLTATGVDAIVVGEVTGGTGRFDDATGTITDHVVLVTTSFNPPTVTSTATSSFSGTISY